GQGRAGSVHGGEGRVVLELDAGSAVAHDRVGVTLVGVAGRGRVGRGVGLGAGEDVVVVDLGVDRVLDGLDQLVELVGDRVAVGLAVGAAGALERQLAGPRQDAADRLHR